MSNLDPGHYLALARELAESKSGEELFEAKQRSAVSRAYYSVFLPARDNKCDPRAKHWQVSQVYGESSDRDSISFGNRLSELHVQRCKADYDEMLDDPGYEAQSAIEEAEKLLQLLGKIAKKKPS